MNTQKNPLFEIVKRDPFWNERLQRCHRKIGFDCALVMRDFSPCVTIDIQPNDVVLKKLKGINGKFKP